MPGLKLEYKWLVGIVYITALFMDLLDTTVTNVAVPTLGRAFSVGPTTIEWVITGYLLSLAMAIPVSGWLGDRFGTKRVFVFALSVFTTGSLLSGLAWSVESLIAFRVLQGTGGGMLTPVGMTMLFRAFPPSERAAASAVLAIPATVAPALGPVLGGYLVDYQSWRWIFFINIPLGVAGLGAAAAFLREDTQATAGKLDLAGFVLSGAGLVSVVYALAEAGQHGFGETRVVAFGLAGIALVAAFVAVELRTAAPMLDVRLLGNKLFGAASLIMLIGSASITGSFFLIPLFLQSQRGLSAFDAGLITFPLAIGIALAAQPGARFYPRIGPRLMIITALTGNMLLTWVLALVNYNTSDWLIAGAMFVRGLFFGLFFIPLQAAGFATVGPEAQGRASSIFNVSRQVAASLGVAVLATALTNRMHSHNAVLADPRTLNGALSAFHDAFLFAGALSILGILAALLIDDRKALNAAKAPTAVPVEEPAHVHIARPASGLVRPASTNGVGAARPAAAPEYAVVGAEAAREGC